MQLGAIFPQTESGTDPGAIREFVQAVEAMGYDYISIYDHVVGAHPSRLAALKWAPYSHESLFHEVFVFLGHVAALTTRLGLATGVLVLPQRETVLVAKQAATLDLLSGGRLRLGVGVGWNEPEYESMGADFHSRGARQAEQIRVMRRLWTDPLVDFDGRFHHLHQVGINPLPVQRPIPVWFGGGSERTLARIARLGDGWMPISNRFEELRQTLARVREMVRQAGRDPAQFGIEGRLSLKGSPEDRAQALAFWREVGASHLSVLTMGLGCKGLTEHLRMLEQVVPELRGP